MMFGPEAIQAAVELGKQGADSGQVITWTAVAMAAISNVGTWLVILKRNTKKTISNPSPPHAALNEAWRVVQEHGETLKEHDTEIKNIVKGMDESRKENREDHKGIFDAINSLRTGKSI